MFDMCFIQKTYVKQKVVVMGNPLAVTTVGEMRAALADYDDGAPIGVWVSDIDGDGELDNVRYHRIESIDTGWILNEDDRTVNIQIYTPTVL